MDRFVEMKDLVDYLYQENIRLEMQLLELTMSDRVSVVNELTAQNETLRTALKTSVDNISDIFSWASQNLNYEQYFSLLKYVRRVYD